jgi:hypothetical protein
MDIDWVLLEGIGFIGLPEASFHHTSVMDRGYLSVDENNSKTAGPHVSFCVK